MVDKSRRKELLQQYSERKPSVGVFAVKCTPTGETWVGFSRLLDKRKNSLWFQLRAGSGVGVGVVDVQPIWKAHGEAAFSFEVLEEITEDNPHKLEVLLDERAQHWRVKLGARPIASL